jgi:formylglycine-generating enzyme required for sulfatase activity
MKTKTLCLLMGLTWLAGVHSALAQVTNLGIAPAGGQSVIYWPASPTNCVLQTTTNLATPNWVTAGNAVTVNAVVVTNSASSGYFRLLAQTNTTAGMVLIPAGSFLMGNYLFYNSATNDPDIRSANPTNIYVSAFYMDTNLVSYGQWRTVYNWATNNGYTFVHAGSGKGANYPVETVGWFDCVMWSNARSQLAGLTPVYYADAGMTQVFTNGETTNVFANWTANGYRLPTEAEWEKAARGGLSGLRFPWGNSISESQANYYAEPAELSYDLGPYTGYNTNFNPGTCTSPVGSFAPNGYGLYDMAGNVYEWCWDWFATPYGQPTTNNPTGPAVTPTGPFGPLNVRVMRGGNWAYAADGARCAFRINNNPDIGGFVGFRCVKGL